MEHAAHLHPFIVPLHPIVVHFPIAFYFLELVLIVLWISKNDPSYQRFAAIAFYLGYAFMLAAMAAGLFDAGGFGNIRGAVRRHVLAALAVFLIYTVRVVFYRRSSRGARLAGAAIGNLAVTYAGFLGGLVVYQ